MTEDKLKKFYTNFQIIWRVASIWWLKRKNIFRRKPLGAKIDARENESPQSAVTQFNRIILQPARLTVKKKWFEETDLIEQSFRLPHKYSVFGDFSKTHVWRIMSPTALSSLGQISFWSPGPYRRKTGPNKQTHTSAQTNISPYSCIRLPY